VLLLQVTKFPFFIVVIVFGFTFQVINSQVSNEDVDMHINMREREREYVVLQELLSAIVLHLFLYLQCKKHNKVSANHKNCVLYYGIH
jgi:hypothetical protein